MPPVIGAVVAYAAGYITLQTLVVVAISTVAGIVAQDEAKRQARAAYNAAQKDRQLMIRSGIAFRQVVYGTAKVSGPIVFLHVSGSKGEYLHVVIALASHRSNAVKGIFFNEDLLPEPDSSGFINTGKYTKEQSGQASKNVTNSGSTIVAFTASEVLTAGSIQTLVYTLPGDGGIEYLQPGSDYNWTPGDTNITLIGSHWLTITADFTLTWNRAGAEPLVRVKWKLGLGDTQTAYEDLVAESGGIWTVNHVGRNVTSIYLRIKFDQDVFGQIGLPNIAALLEGKLVRDTRIGTDVFTDNALLCHRDFLLDKIIGPGCSAESLAVNAALNLEADICDEQVEIAPGVYQARYTVNGVLSSDTPIKANNDKFLLAHQGGLVYVGGAWKIRVGAARLTGMDLDEDFFSDTQIEINPKTERRSLFNQVAGTFIDPERSYTEAQFPVVKNALYLAEDKKEYRLTVNFELVNDGIRAQRLAKIMLEKSRQATRVATGFNMRAYDLMPLNWVGLNLALLGWEDKPFEVETRQISLEKGLAYVLKETAPSVYDWNLGEETLIDPNPDSNLPDPRGIPEKLVIDPNSLTSGTEHLEVLVDGTINTRAKVVWQRSTNIYVLSGGFIEVQWKYATDVEMTLAPPVPGDSENTYLTSLVDSRVILVQIRQVSSTGVASPWSVYNPHTVVGKEEPPSNVEEVSAIQNELGVEIKWKRITDPDVRAYALRQSDVSINDWSLATPLVETSTDLWQWRMSEAGNYRIYVKALDAKRESEVAAVTTIIVKVGEIQGQRYWASGSEEGIEWVLSGFTGFIIDYYLVQEGQFLASAVEVGRPKDTSWKRTVPQYGRGNRFFWVTAVDARGNKGKPVLIQGVLSVPSEVRNLRVRVIDNNVLIYWDPPEIGSLNIKQYRVRKGDVFASSQDVGYNGNSTFAAIFEQVGGVFKYWLVPSDMADNEGPETYVQATVSQPPDYVFKLDVDSKFTGTRTRCLREVLPDGDTHLIMPADVTETWDQHFSTRSWANPDAQIAAGYPIYIQPVPTSGVIRYEEIIDYGVELAQTVTATTTLATIAISGTVTLTVEISKRRLTTDPWTAVGTGLNVLIPASVGDAFRYVRLRVNGVPADNKSVVKIDSMNFKLGLKKRKDSGEGVITNAAAGVTVPFNIVPGFVDCSTPIVQPSGTAPRLAIVDFTDVPNPVSFKVYLVDLAGTFQTGSFSWSVDGV